ncbi:MAG: hypothetical protein Q9184_005518 [Pyrenodesmia sp. 2 TL-2023]
MALPSPLSSRSRTCAPPATPSAKTEKSTSSILTPSALSMAASTSSFRSLTAPGSPTTTPTASKSTNLTPHQQALDNFYRPETGCQAIIVECQRSPPKSTPTPPATIIPSIRPVPYRTTTAAPTSKVHYISDLSLLGLGAKAISLQLPYSGLPSFRSPILTSSPSPSSHSKQPTSSTNTATHPPPQLSLPRPSSNPATPSPSLLPPPTPQPPPPSSRTTTIQTRTSPTDEINTHEHHRQRLKPRLQVPKQAPQ